MIMHKLGALAVAVAVSLGGTAAHGAAQQPFEAFGDFLTRVKNVETSHFLGTAGVHVESAAAFEEMRAHILRMYEG